MRFNLLLLAAMTAVLCACDGSVGRHQDEHLIGTKLKDVSSIVANNGESQNIIAMYDPTVNRVHQFDLTNNTLVRSVGVQQPGVEHYVLYNPSGNYMIDFSTKHISIFNHRGEANHNPIEFVGTPKSAAFRPELGLLVMYDDKMSVGVIQLDFEGRVQRAKLFVGAFGGVSISAGDLDESGRLIAALSNGKIAVVNLAAALESGEWAGNYTTVNTSLDNPVWLSTVGGNPSLVLVQQDRQISMVNLTTQAVTNGPDVSRRQVMHYGRGPDAHILYEDPRDRSLMQVAYIDGGAIKTRQISFAPNAILNSNLDLKAKRWTVISAKTATYDWGKGKNVYSGRSVNRYIFNADGFLAYKNENLPEHARFELGVDRLFALIPSKMGYALNYELNGFTKRELVHFNIPYIR